MLTSSIKKDEIKRDWFIVDADNQTLGRLASEIAQVIRGKKKPNFTPNLDMGDFVVVINAEKVAVTGSKEEQKKYFSHSGFPGGEKEVSLSSLRRKHPERIIYNAVKGMLPHNRLGRKLIKHLKVYTGTEHPHVSQQPKQFNI
ncbi:MAG: 50S ribosomal protein L13 [bacterium TMED161]|nr:MAG: 50S ribosomal protein L13 [bacterium TMED161]|tara:strand:+ start:553 stop:981 length:429 start_codon:yes stop_codon:yes gene_type:complete